MALGTDDPRHQVATLDRISEGNLVFGVGFAADLPNIRAEFVAAGVPFEHRIGRMMEGLCLRDALWSGQPVDREGRWQMIQAVVAPTPARPGGPLLWIGGNLPGGLDHAGKYFDGWFPSAPDAPEFAAGLSRVRDVARDNGRDPASVSGSMYLTASLDDDAAKAEDRLNHFLERYCGQFPPWCAVARLLCRTGCWTSSVAY